MAKAYTDLLLRIGAREEGKPYYPVEALLDDGSFFFGGEFPNNFEAIASTASLEAYGQALFQYLFASPIGRAYERAIGRPYRPGHR